MERKTPCSPILSETDLAPSEQAKGHECKYCRRKFASRPSLTRHMRQNCKIANSEEGMEKLMEHTVQQQMARIEEQNAELRRQMSRLTDMMEKGLTTAPPTVHNHTNIGIVQQNTVQVNVVSFSREDRIRVPIGVVKAAFTENPRLVEYCQLSDSEKTDLGKAAPYVLEALVDLVRRVHRDPLYRNVYLNPRRADQVIVCLDDEKGVPRQWEVRPLVDAIRLLFDGVADNLHNLLFAENEWKVLPLDVQSAAAWLPGLYEQEPERFVAGGRQAMAAHLVNTRPAGGGHCFP